MKILILLLLSANVFAQTTARKGPVLFGSSQQKPDASAVVEFLSTSKGILPPRLTNVQRDAIVSPARGLEIYNVDSDSPQFFNGVTWVSSGGTGTSFLFTSVAHGRIIGCPLSPVFFDGSNWVDAVADNMTTLATHVITKVIDADTLEISQSGRFGCNGHGLTAGLHYYTGVSGGISNFPAPAYDNPIIFIENANTIHVMPYRASTPAIRTTSQVDLVFGRLGDVVAESGDYNAGLITFTPTGTLTATDVQTAIAQLDSTVSATNTSLSNFVLSGRAVGTAAGLTGGGDLTEDREISLSIGELPQEVPAAEDRILMFDGAAHFTSSLEDVLSGVSLNLGSLTDVDTTALNGQVLTFNGTDFSFTDKTVDTDSQDASQVPFSPFSFYASTDVQSIVPEIETSLRTDISSKAEASRQITVGSGLVGGGDLTSDINIDLDPAAIDITSLNGFNSNSFIDMSTLNIDVSSVNDGIQGFNTSLDSDVTLAIDIPSLSQETPARINTFLMGFSTTLNRLVRVEVQDVADTAAAAVVAPISQVNGQIGVVNLTTNDVPETSSRVYVSPLSRDQIGLNATAITALETQQTANTSQISNNQSSSGINSAGIASNLAAIAVNTSDLDAAELTISSLGAVAFSDNYTDLNGLPTLGDIADNNEADFATASQGLLADSAIQSGDNVSELVNDAGFLVASQIPVVSVNTQTGNVVLDADDIDDTTTAHKFATQAQLDLIATNVSDIIAANGNISANTASIGSNDLELVDHETRITQNEVDIATNLSNINTNDTELAGHETRISDNETDIATNTGNISANSSDIAALSTVASTGDYNDLSNLPTLGTAAATDITDYATSAQGLLADSATQPLDNISTLTNDSNFIDASGAPVQTVNAQSGAVVLDADDIDDTTTAHRFATAAQLTQIATNTTEISGNDTDIAANAVTIAANTANIVSNDVELSTFSGNITTNTVSIEGLDLRLTPAETQIADNLAELNLIRLERILCVSTTDSTTNVNFGTAFVEAPVFGTFTNINDDGSFTVVSPTQVRVNFTGVVEINSNIRMTSTGQRVALEGIWTLDDAAVTGISSTGYIRAVSGHNSASIHHSGSYVEVTSGQILELKLRRESTTTTATFMTGSVNNISIRRINQ